MCYLFVLKEEWVTLIGFCLLLSHEFSNIAFGLKKFGDPWSRRCKMCCSVIVYIMVYFLIEFHFLIYDLTCI